MITHGKVSIVRREVHSIGYSYLSVRLFWIIGKYTHGGKMYLGVKNVEF